jgi:hypothetical protein
VVEIVSHWCAVLIEFTEVLKTVCHHKLNPVELWGSLKFVLLGSLHAIVKTLVWNRCIVNSEENEECLCWMHLNLI